MVSGTASISRGWPTIQVIQLASDRGLRAKSLSQIAGDDVVQTALTNPPRVGDVRPIAALLPDVLALYGLAKPSVPTNEAAAQCGFGTAGAESSIDVSV